MKLFKHSLANDSILAMLGLTEADVERFRDCWMVVGEKEQRIVIETRTGGLNRETWPNKKLTSHPCFIIDYDDDCDPTYAYYEFEIPEMYRGESDES